MTKSKNIDEYIKAFPTNTQKKLQQIRKIIITAAPNAEETISYQIPCFKINGKYLIYFAGWKNHVSLYPIPKGDENYQKIIKPYVAGKGTLKFKLDADLPLEVIGQSIKFRIQENSDDNY